MPVEKRRKSVQADGNGKEQGTRMPVDPNTDVGDRENAIGASSVVESGSTPSNTESGGGPKQSSRQEAATTSRNGNVPAPTVGTVTRSSSRLVKRPRRDLSPPESPVKKAVKETKTSSTPEGAKTKRQWELWSIPDIDTFFEGLFEHGKDFDAIQNLIAQKCKKKGQDASLIKNKDQVRHFFYRTCHKISKYVGMSEDVKKETQELYGLINYGVLRKKMTGWSEKTGQKLNELIHNGYTLVKFRGKKTRIKTPVCNALKKLNNVDGEQKIEASPKIPERISVEFGPKTNAAFAHVQELAQNPRLRITVKPERKVSTVIQFLEKKWKCRRLKLKENLVGADDALPEELTVYPHRDSEVTPISLKTPKEPKVHLAFSDYKENILGSPAAAKSKKTVKEECKVPSDNSSEVPESVISDSPRVAKVLPECKDNSDNACAHPVNTSLFQSAQTSSASVLHNVPNIGFGLDMNSISDCDNAMCADTFNMHHSSGSAEPSGVEASAAEKDPAGEQASGEESSSQTEREELEESINKGWNAARACNLTFAQLFLMTGKNGELRLEYEWCKKKSIVDECLVSTLANMLRRLAHLATMEFTDFSKAKPGPTNTGNSPCHTCGAVKAKGHGNSKGSGRGQTGNRPVGRNLANARADGLVDVGTQTPSGLQNRENENFHGPKDPVFRVPVVGPGILQHRPTTTLTDKQLVQQIHPTSMLNKPPARNRKLRTVRKPTLMPKTILPKAVPGQRLNFMPIMSNHIVQHMINQPLSTQTVVGQPVGIQLSMPSVSMTTTGSLDSQSQPVFVRSDASSPVPSQSPLVVGVPLSSVVTSHIQTGQITVTAPSSTSGLDRITTVSPPSIMSEASMTALLNMAVASTSCTISSTLSGMDVITTARPSMHSPPNISSLLEISVPDTGGLVSSDRFIDLALGNSTASFSDILDSSNSKGPSFPSTSLIGSESRHISPPRSPNRSPFKISSIDTNWLNGEGSEISFSTLLADSPLKQRESNNNGSNLSLGNYIIPLPALFGENSRDLGSKMDVDTTLQCMMNESSMDYVSKFADLAAQIIQGDNSSSNRKGDFTSQHGS